MRHNESSDLDARKKTKRAIKSAHVLEEVLQVFKGFLDIKFDK